MKGVTKPLAPWTTLKGQASTEVAQASDGWIDLSDFEDLAVNLDVAFLYATTASNIEVIVETAQMPDAISTDWQEVVKRTSVGATLVYAGAREAATTHFLRFLRWRVAGGVTGSDWTATFKVDATVR